MNYENMTDFEINKAVAETDKRFNSCIDVEFFMSDSNDKAVDVVSQGLLICTVDYCNDWAYGGPVIQSAKISLIKTDDDCWTAFEWKNDENEIWHKNPLRAAMIVCLMMNEDKK